MAAGDHGRDAGWPAALEAELGARRKAGLLRQRVTLDGPQGVAVSLDGARRLSFCSNDYLALADHPDIKRTLIEAAGEHGVGSGASHLVTGHHRLHQQLEDAVATFCRRERALVFSTGYMANVGTISALIERGDAVFADRLVHASLIDGALLSGARLSRYAHASPADLDARLSKSRARRKLVVTDGVFSMDGDVAPLPELATVCARHGAWLMVDDAHGFGVLGEGGRGSVDDFGLSAADVPVLVGTFGKAFGTFGAFVAGDARLIEYLLQKARAYIYTTALPPALAAATLTALGLVAAEPWRLTQLRARVDQFRRGAADLGLPLMAAVTPIQPLVLGDPERVVAASGALARRRIHVTAIRPPTVPKGSARLRVTFSAGHTAAQVESLLEALAATLSEGAAQTPVEHAGRR